MTVRLLLEKETDPGKQDKTAVLVVGRFQPPSLGHARIVDAAKKAFHKYKYDAIFICVIAGKQTSKIKSVNPLSAKSRQFYLQHSTFTKGTKIITASNTFDAFLKVRNLGFEPMCVVGGKDDNTDEDRAEAFKKLLDKYLTDTDGSPIEHKAITVTRTEGSKGTEGVSGSIARAAAKADRFDDFAEMVSFDNPVLVRKLFDEIKACMESEHESV
jgi:hypothetical protein